MGIKSALIRNSIAYGLTALTVITAAQPAAAQQRSYKIADMPLSEALRQFGQTSGRQIIFAEDLVRGRRATALNGSYSPEEALRRLLTGTGLSSRPTPAGVIMIVPQEGPGAAQDSALRGGAATGGPAEEAEEDDESQDIVVTGTNIRGVAPVGSQLISATREEILEAGYGRVEDYLQTLPQNFTGGASEDTIVIGTVADNVTLSNSNRGSAVNLRGQGSNATLTLLNGYRMAPGGESQQFVDISIIPLSAIDRIEVLPDGASALYGADAVGGVVNFVLRNDYDGAETSARLALPTRGGGREIQLSQAFGTSWATGRFLAVYEYSERNHIRAADRDFLVRGGELFASLNSNPGTIRVVNPATGLPVTFAIPEGSDGNLTADDLVPGTSNLENLTVAQWTIPDTRRHSIVATASQDLGDRIRLFGQVLATQRELEVQNRGRNVTLTVTNANPFYVNPFGGTGPIQVVYNLRRDIGPLGFESTIKSLNSVVGAEAKIGSWTATLSGTYSVEDTYSLTPNSLVSSRLTAAARGTGDPATSFNPFGDGSVTNPALLATLTEEYEAWIDNVLWSAEFLATGPLVHLPGGELRAAVGAQYRDLHYKLSAESPSSAPFSQGLDRTAKAAFAELYVPIFSELNRVPGIQELTLSAAVRHERYSDFGATTVPRFGLNWRPVEWLGLRGSYSKSFRAPAGGDLDKLYNGQYISNFPDPQSPTGTTTAQLFYGNADTIEAERSTSWTFGLQLQFPGRQSPRLSVDFFDINYRGRIQNPFSGLAQSNYLIDAAVAPFINRNATPADQAALCAGTVRPADLELCTSVPVSVIIDSRVRNVARTITRGVDVNLSHNMPVGPGNIAGALNLTYLIDNDYQSTAAAPTLSRLNLESNPIDLKARASLIWSGANASLGAHLNYQDSYESQRGEPIDSLITADLSARYTLPDNIGPASNLTFVLSVRNIFDQSPPWVANSVGYDPSNGDIVGRVVSLQARIGW